MVSQQNRSLTKWLALLVACLFFRVLRSSLMAIIVKSCSHVCASYRFRSLLKTIHQRIASIVVSTFFGMDAERMTLNEGNINTKL